MHKRKLSPRTIHPQRFLDDAALTALEPGATAYRVWDIELAGLNVHVIPTGAKTLSFYYKTETHARWYTLGRFPKQCSAADARREALAVGASVSAGEDPQAGRQVDRRDAMSVGWLISAYLERGPLSRPAKRETSWKTDRSNLERHVRPVLGKVSLGRIRRDDVGLLIAQIRDGGTAGVIRTRRQGYARVRGGLEPARRALCATSAMFTWAIEQGYLKDNPVKGFRLPKAPARERFLSAEEAKHLFTTLDRLEREEGFNSGFGDILRLLLLTGARKMEIQALQWREIDLVRRRLVLQPERTKSGGVSGTRVIPLSEAACDILRHRLKTEESVFPANKGVGAHTTGLQKAWSELREAAGFQGLRIHDLRHSFASLALLNSENIYTISRVLGHSSTRTTERYMHLSDTTTQALSERTSQLIMGK